MRDINYYLDTAKKKNGFKSDLQLNRELGFKGSMVSFLRKGKSHISDEKMIELARLAGENPELALMDLNYMRADGEAKTTYKRMIELLRKSLHMLSVIVVLMVASTPSNAANISTDMAKHSLNQDIHYHINNGGVPYSRIDRSVLKF